MRRVRGDVRDEVADPRNFVLGWDNREKRRVLAAEVKKLVVRWPSGVVQVLENLKIGQEHKVIEPKKTSP